MGRKDKPRIIPEQDKRICGTICICQLTVVVSCVAIVYLSVAIYSPSLKAFKSGFEADTVMCQTINTTMANNCASTWASCGEWCLTKTTGFCPQIHATVRRNGTDVLFENCTRSIVTQCPQVSTRDLKRYNCNNGTSSECTSLNGVFNCSLGHCANFSELFECHFKADGFVVDAEKDNMKLNGFFFCKNSNCTHIKKSFPCDRYCSKITTSLMNTFVMHNNSVTTLDCEAAYATTEAQGSDPGLRLSSPVKIWDESMGYLLTHCIDIQRIGDSNNFNAFDCLNGTLLESYVVPEPYTNFTTFWKIYDNSSVHLDPTQKYLPRQSTLTIYNTTKLFINLEGCVNTLRGECKEFLFTHGQDGAKNTAQSRFQCFYNKHHSEFVLARFDLGKTWRELMIAVIVPSSLFLISLTALCVISQTVRVGDDAKMRCCLGTESDDTEQIVNSTSNSNRMVGKNMGTIENTQHPQTSPQPMERINGMSFAMPVGAKCDGSNRVQEISDLLDQTNENVMIPLNSPVEAEQKNSQGIEVAESCLSTSVSVEHVSENKETAERPGLDPFEPLMIL